MSGVTLHEREGCDACVSTSEHLIALAREGRLPKPVLASLLEIGPRQDYLDACARIERRYTDECIAENDPCLESGCAVEGEICLQPLLKAGTAYDQACGRAWVTFFGDPRNRVDPWRTRP